MVLCDAGYIILLLQIMLITINIVRTGDIVQCKQDFLLSCRNDDMVKIRGNRIELGEIEHCIAKLAAVDDVAMIAVTDAKQTKLICFVVASGSNLFTIKQHVSEHLPKYMIPNALQLIKHLPYTLNGKVNRQGLAQLMRDKGEGNGTTN